jgi:hypothetical protein
MKVHPLELNGEVAHPLRSTLSLSASFHQSSEHTPVDSFSKFLFRSTKFRLVLLVKRQVFSVHSRQVFVVPHSGVMEDL